MKSALIRLASVLLLCATFLWITNKVCKTWIICTALENGAATLVNGKK